MEVDEEDHALSADNDCISDCSSNFTEYINKIVSAAEINALNAHSTKFCIIYFYYSTGGALAVCLSCIIALQGMDSQMMYAVRKHKSETQCDGWPILFKL